jgi:hypothetical protein
MATLQLLILNPFICFQCKRFGHTQHRCVSILVRYNCESGNGEPSCPLPPPCEKCTQVHPVAISSLCLWVRQPFKNFESKRPLFSEAKKFFESRPKARTPSY